MGVVGETSQVQQDIRLLVNTAYIRDGKQRLPTPEKHAVFKLVAKEESKKRLGKQQQLLTEIARRCREQEVLEMSGNLTRKCTLTPGVERSSKEMVAHSWPRSECNFIPDDVSSDSISEGSAPNSLVCSSTNFPKRKIIKRRDMMPSAVNLPRLKISYRKGVTPSEVPHRTLIVGRTRMINGPIQLDHYVHAREDQLAPLILPSIKYIGIRDHDRVDAYIRAHKLTIVPKINNDLDLRAGASAASWHRPAIAAAPADPSATPRVPPPTERV